jgi:predicted nucleic acid-binding protein
MSGRAFLDTNILIYAHDRGAGAKQERAREAIAELWNHRSGVLSTQVLQEFYMNVRRKAANPISRSEARRTLENYLSWTIVINDGDSILRALDLERRYTLSFWDALIVQAAQQSGAERLLSEDFKHGRRFGDVMIVNPFED